MIPALWFIFLYLSLPFSTFFPFDPSFFLGVTSIHLKDAMNYTKWDKFDIEKALDLVEDDSERQKKYLLSQSSDEHDLKIIKHRIHLREAELKHIFATTKCSINLFQDLESTLESLSNKISVDILKSAGTGRRRRPAATDEPPAPHSPASIHHVEKGFVRSLLGLSSFFVMAFTEIKTLFELSISVSLLLLSQPSSL